MEEIQQLNKGGKCWLELSPIRGRGGLELRVKAVPELEDFMKSLGDGDAHSTSIYNRNWYSLDPTKELMLYNMSKNLVCADSKTEFELGRPCDGLQTRDGDVNLSFLRLVGISSPQGVSFGIVGPHSRPLVKKLLTTVLEESRKLILEFLVPIHINLRLSSTEL